MSKITYKIGRKRYSFDSDLQIVNMLAVETCLIDEIKKNMKENSIKGIIHDVTITDENGIIASANDFKQDKLCLTIQNIEKNETV